MNLPGEDKSYLSKKYMLEDIVVFLAGRIAEDVVFDDVNTGASNDIERATKTARKMVAEWGMTESIGLISYGDGGEIFVGRDYQKQISYSQDLANKIDAEVKKIIDNAHKIASKILLDKKDVIEKVVQILLDKETIYKEEFEMLYNGATVEEVEAAIDKKEKEKREYQEKAKREAIEEHKTRDIKTRVETAEALAKAGVISKQDLENIKKEAEKEFARLNEMLKAEEAKTSEKAENKKENDSDEDKK